MCPCPRSLPPPHTQAFTTPETFSGSYLSDTAKPRKERFSCCDGPRGASGTDMVGVRLDTRLGAPGPIRVPASPLLTSPHPHTPPSILAVAEALQNSVFLTWPWTHGRGRENVAPHRVPSGVPCAGPLGSGHSPGHAGVRHTASLAWGRFSAGENYLVIYNKLQAISPLWA